MSLLDECTENLVSSFMVFASRPSASCNFCVCKSGIFSIGCRSVRPFTGTPIKGYSLLNPSFLVLCCSVVKTLVDICLGECFEYLYLEIKTIRRQRIIIQLKEMYVIVFRTKRSNKRRVRQEI